MYSKRRKQDKVRLKETQKQAKNKSFFLQKKYCGFTFSNPDIQDKIHTKDWMKFKLVRITFIQMRLWIRTRGLKITEKFSFNDSTLRAKRATFTF